MAGTMRKEKLSKERQAALVTSGGWPGRLGRQVATLQIPSLYILSGLLFAIVAVLPLRWGLYPLPYYLGYVADTDKLSRVSFKWRDREEEESRIEALRKDYPRRYTEEFYADWVNKVSGPLWPLAEEAAKAKDAAALMAKAKEKKVALTKEQAEVLIREIQGAKDWIRPFAHIVVPIQDVLRERIHNRGLLSAKRYQAERKRTIQIVSHLNEVRRTPVGEEVGKKLVGPVDPAAVSAILDEGLSDKMHHLSLEFRTAIRDILLKRMQPSLIFDEPGTEAELQAQIDRIRSQSNEVQKGDILLGRGQHVTPAILRKLRREEEHYRSRLGWSELAQRFVGKAILVLAIVIGALLYLCHIERAGPRRDRRTLGMAVLAALIVTSAYLTIYWGRPETLVPIGLVAGVVGLSMGGRVAVLAVTAVSLVLMVLFEGRPGIIGGHLASGWLFACLVRSIRHRLALLSTAALCGIIAAAVVITWGLALGEVPVVGVQLGSWIEAGSQRYLLERSFCAVASWLATGVVLLLVLPVIESLFYATTNVSLQELQDQEQPCLKQLVVQAPGTYHHSVIVGTLAEAAAADVGANPLLARVGSYYHDIGKLMKPEYFSENEAGVSRHDSLSPTMSALIIIAHVKDGAEMAREYGLPRAIIDIIEQHHGKGLVTFFHHRAQKQAQEDETVSEEPFRYPGPIPRSAEAALVMLADSVEAASRAMESPTPAHIRKRVREIIMRRLLDRQLDASGLTLSDLNHIEDAFVRILTSMFHSRVRYPGQEGEGDRKGRK